MRKFASGRLLADRDDRLHLGRHALTKVAPDFPNIHFVMIDSVVDPPNVQSVVFKSKKPRTSPACSPPRQSKTGKVGFVGGMDIPLIHAFFCGYKEGFMATNAGRSGVRELHRHHAVSLERSGHGAGELAKADFDKGADIVYAAAGGSGLGVIQAAKDAGKLVDRRRQQPELHRAGLGADLGAEARRRRRLQRLQADDAGFKAGRHRSGVAENGVGSRHGRQQQAADHRRHAGRGR